MKKISLKLRRNTKATNATEYALREIKYEKEEVL